MSSMTGRKTLKRRMVHCFRLTKDAEISWIGVNVANQFIVFYYITGI